jgi:hypothetical protein
MSPKGHLKICVRRNLLILRWTGTAQSPLQFVDSDQGFDHGVAQHQKGVADAMIEAFVSLRFGIGDSSSCSEGGISNFSISAWMSSICAISSAILVSFFLPVVTP